TSLAVMIPPIGLLAAWQYYKNGYVDIKVAGLMCVGFLLGGLLGAKVATTLSNNVLEKVFGIVLLAIGIKMIFFPKGG
ncbi:MAG: TSUP family transporter, partial [Terriglobales bacterium]